MKSKKNTTTTSTSSSEPRISRVTLPKEVMDVVNELCCCQTSPCSCPACEIYLVGSTVLDLIQNEKISEQKDFDFLMITDSPKWLEQFSFSKFIRHDRIPNHYIRNTRQFGGVSADLMIKSTTLLDDANTRDLSLCALFIRVNGRPDDLGLIYDPTGLGLSDLQFKRLNTIEEPLCCFNRDPIRILRAIKYLMRGYTPEARVIDALRQWDDPRCYENDHFIAVLTRQLELPSYFEFIHQLKLYGLVSKMSWANASNDESHDIIAIKFLSTLYLRYYQRTILNYVYPDLFWNTNDALFNAYQYLSFAEHRKHHAQKYLEQLQEKNNLVNMKLIQVQQEVSSQQKKVALLMSQINQKTNLFLRKNELIKAVATQTESRIGQLKKNAELQHELDALYQKIETQVQIRLKDNAQIRLAQVTAEQQALEKTQHELSVVLEKNRLQELKLIKLREQHTHSTQQTQENDAQLQRIKNELLELQIMQNSPKDDSSQFNPVYECFLDSLDDNQLESLLYKISFLDFKAIIAYQLGCHAQNEQFYFKALNYLYMALDLAPNNKATQTRIDAIKLQLNLNVSEKNAEEWCAMGEFATQENNTDKAITYYIFALQCDSKYVNAYVRRMNIFYEQNHWAEFAADFNKLTLIMDDKTKTANRETQASLDKINQAIKKRISTAVNKQIDFLNEIEPSVEGLNAAWWYTITFKLLPLSRVEIESCYQKIIVEDPNKSVEYGMAHLQLAQGYYAQKKFQLAGNHYHEAVLVIPCLRGLHEDLEKFKPLSFLNSMVSSAQQYVRLGESYYQANCYNVALHIFQIAMATFPKDINAYWATINSCYKINQPAWISEETLDGLIRLYLQLKQTNQPVVNYLRPLSELYLYKSDYFKARETIKLLESNHYNECVFFCSNLNETLSSSLVDEIKTRNKKNLHQLYASGILMLNTHNWFFVCYGLGKIAKDDGDLTASLHYFLQAKALGSQPSYAYSYQQVLLNILSIYKNTRQFEAANHQIQEIFMQHDPQSAIYNCAKHIQELIEIELKSTKEDDLKSSFLEVYTPADKITFFSTEIDPSKTNDLSSDLSNLTTLLN